MVAAHGSARARRRSDWRGRARPRDDGPARRVRTPHRRGSSGPARRAELARRDVRLPRSRRERTERPRGRDVHVRRLRLARHAGHPRVRAGEGRQPAPRGARGPFARRARGPRGARDRARLVRRGAVDRREHLAPRARAVRSAMARQARDPRRRGRRMPTARPLPRPRDAPRQRRRVASVLRGLRPLRAHGPLDQPRRGARLPLLHGPRANPRDAGGEPRGPSGLRTGGRGALPRALRRIARARPGRARGRRRSRPRPHGPRDQRADRAASGAARKHG